MSAWTIYLITRLDSISTTCGVVIFFGTIALVIGTIMYWVGKYNKCEQGRETAINFTSKIKYGWLGLCVFVLLSIIAPTTKDACVIYVLPKVVNNEEVAKIPANFTKLVNTKMEEWLGQFEPALEGEKDGK